MHRTLLWIGFILSYDFVSAENADKCIPEELLASAVDKLSAIVDPIKDELKGLNEKLQEINEEVKIQKSTIESVKESLNAEKDEVEELLKAVENVSFKQLQNQKSIRVSLKSQQAQLGEIEKVIITGFSKVRQKLNALSQVSTSIIEIYEEIEKLATVYNQQEAKLVNLYVTLKNIVELVEHTSTNNTKRLEIMQKDLLKVLDEQTKPLSNEALSHVSKAEAIVKTISSEMEKFSDLELQLLNLYRLSEDLKEKIPTNNLVSNLTISLESLKDLAPSIISSVSKGTKEVNSTLHYLKAMSKDNNCPVDLTSEIQDHHNKIIKFLNDSIAERKNKQGDEEIWKNVMMKFDNILTDSITNGDISEKLVKLREDVNNIRELLWAHFGETDDTVFG